jgi:hypothetical protein
MAYIYIYNQIENTSNMKRTTRKVSEETKKKMSEGHKANPVIFTDELRKKMSERMKAYWATIPHDDINQTDNTTKENEK